MPYRLIIKTADGKKLKTNVHPLSRQHAWELAKEAAAAHPRDTIRIVRTDARRPGEASAWEHHDGKMMRTNNVPIPETFWNQ